LAIDAFSLPHDIILRDAIPTPTDFFKDGKLPAKQFNGAGYRIQKRDLEQIQTDILSPAI
jgi:hypothetical protein